MRQRGCCRLARYEKYRPAGPAPTTRTFIDLFLAEELDDLLAEPAVAGIGLEALVPVHSDVGLGNRHRQRQRLEVAATLVDACHARRQREDEVGALEHHRHYREMWHAQRDAPRDAGALERLLDDAVAAAIADENVRRIEERLLCQR